MSKVDAQRAMREAKYARQREGAAARRTSATGTEPPAASPEKAAEGVAQPRRAPEARAATVQQPDAPTPPEERSQDVCGHRSMNGRTCTREAGHEQKNHRYS